MCSGLFNPTADSVVYYNIIILYFPAERYCFIREEKDAHDAEHKNVYIKYIFLFHTDPLVKFNIDTPINNKHV